MREYRRRFETLASSLTELPEEVMECNFLNSLKPEKRADVQLLRPVGLEQIMEVAQRVEDRNSITQGGLVNISPIKPKSIPYHSPNPPQNTYNSSRSTIPVKLSNPH